MLARPMSEVPTFRPPFWARGAVWQTLLAQLPFRTWGSRPVVDAEREEVVRLSHGISLQGIYSAVRTPPVRGLAILLSGWEGHARATYMVRTADSLYRAGFDVYRLTYPDHGDTHDLNEAVFHFGMLDKITEALHRIVGAIRTRPVLVVGFSMGGNLALNLACRGLPGLKGVFAVSPALNFAEAMTTLQKSVFHGPFLKLWKASLERKQKLFPGRFDFKEAAEAESVAEVAGDLLSLQGRIPSLADYASRYSVTARKLQQLMVPAHVITSVDDPIVGRANYEQFAGIERLGLHVQQAGGHVGFIDSLLGPAWYDRRMLELIDQVLTPRPRLLSTGAADAAPLPE
jgi:predicted alpha/beta-fold hydrolase